jgi:hypothetical protein
MDSTLVAETAVSGLVLLAGAPWALIATGRLSTARPRQRAAEKTSAGDAADVAPASLAETTTEEHVPLASVPAASSRPKNGKLSTFATQRARNEHGQFVPLDRAS